MKHLLAGAIVLWCAAACHADQPTWAESLFNKLEHDFGVVAGGADTRHTFTITNRFLETIRITAFTASCGCTQISIGGKVIQPKSPGETVTLASADRIVLRSGEKVDMEVALDTFKFVGQRKSSTITVTFDEPTRADVRLTITGTIRQDVVLNPGTAQLGTLPRGQGGTKTIEVEYAGKLDFRINAFEWQNTNLTVDLQELYRREGGAGYRVTLKVKETAPPGALRETVVLKTNDPNTGEIPLLVSAQIQPDVIITPAQVSFGEVRHGKSETKKLLLRGNKPFQITGIEGADELFEAEFTDKVDRIHTLTIRFKAGQAGRFERLFRVKTSIDGEPPLDVRATATVSL